MAEADRCATACVCIVDVVTGLPLIGAELLTAVCIGGYRTRNVRFLPTRLPTLDCGSIFSAGHTKNFKKNFYSFVARRSA